MYEALAETWLINNRVTLRMLGELGTEALECTVSTRGGRTVGQQLVHVYEVRRRKLEQADRTLAADLPPVAREQGNDKALLVDAFKRSGDAVAKLIRRSAAVGGSVKGFRRGIVALVGYFIAHDAHHRGHILLTMKLCGVRRSPELQMGLWGWNQI
jgi:uncharacterized damage-inducible protein DinB